MCAGGRAFFFNDTATTEIYTLSLHDALPICPGGSQERIPTTQSPRGRVGGDGAAVPRKKLSEACKSGFMRRWLETLGLPAPS